MVATWQLREDGIGPDAIKRRVADRRLNRRHQGVYAVGLPPYGAHGNWMAAVLAGGPEALLSHREAAALWELRGSSRSAVDITIPGGGGRRRRSGITIHRTATFHDEDRAVVDGIPVTSVARTLLDLATVLDATQVRRAYERAERLRLLDAGALARVLARNAGRRGAPLIRSLLNYDPSAAAEAASELERMCLDLIHNAGLPTPQVNVLVEGYLVDLHWPEARLVVELDGYEFHSDRKAFERDRQKIATLQTAGHTVLPFTHRQVSQQGAWVVCTIRNAIARNASCG